MAAASKEFMGLLPELFPRTLGEAVAQLVRQKYPTAKALARAWDIDLKTAETVRGGQCGVRALWSGVAAEGWGFLQAFGETATGETYDKYQERKLAKIIQEAEDARANLVRLRSRREALERRAAGVGDVLSRQGSSHVG